MRHSCILSAVFASAVLFASCDDGSVTDPVYVDSSKTYKAQLIATFHGLDQWGSSYKVALAGFNDDSRYSVIQKDLQAHADKGVADTILLAGIPDGTEHVEFAVVNVLRQRIATLYSVDIESNHDAADTIKINLGEFDASPFGAVKTAVFHGSNTNCVMCHQGDRPAAGLNLAADDVYDRLVNTYSSKSTDSLLVCPGDASKSFLYQVITSGSTSLHYSHPGIFVEDDVKYLPELIKGWIDEGAKN